MIKISEPIIRRLTIEQPGSPTIFKRIFNFSINACYFAIILAILFSIKSIPLKIADVRSAFFSLSLIVLVWRAARVSTYNFHISYLKGYVSQIFSIVTLLYVFIISLLFKATNFQDWNKVANIFFILTSVLLAFQATWKLAFVFIERRARPFFAWEQFYRFLSTILSIAFIWSLANIVDNVINAIDKNIYYDWQNFHNLFAIVSAFFLFLGLNVTMFFSKKYIKHNKINREVRKIVIITSAVLILFPTAIRFILANDYGQMDLMNVLYMTIVIIISVCTIILPLFGGSLRGNSVIFSFVITSAMLFIIVIGFFISQQTSAKAIITFSIMLVGLLIQSILMMLAEPKITMFYAFIYGLTFRVTAITVIVYWILNSFLGSEFFFVYKIVNQIAFAFIIEGVVALELITGIQVWWIVRTISFNSGKINKLEEVKNV